MRRITRDFILGMAVIVALLLALGAVPSYLQSGDPYYLTVTPTEGSGAVTTATNATAVDAGNLSAQRYPYTVEALDDVAGGGSGQSSAYYRGPIGIKGAFTHSPFDEYDALAQRYPSAVDGAAVRVTHQGVLYRLTVTQEV